MKIEIARDGYLKELNARRENGLVKIISGLRRCGKSYLLNTLFKRQLTKERVPERRIISVALDNILNEELLEPRKFYDYVVSRMRGRGMHYLFVDEIQELPQFEKVINGLMQLPNLDIYVTGSNSRFLTNDVVTEFRGRGDEVRVHPLSFAEFYAAAASRGADKATALRDYLCYGGMPYILHCTTEQQKQQYLKKLFTETYLKDIVERNSVRNSAELEEIVNIVASGIGGLTNPLKLQRRFESIRHLTLTAPTIRRYISLLEDSYLVHKALRYDVRGKRYISTPFKLYFADLGLRNARLDFRQQEPPHAMENLIYIELLLRGCSVDVGEVRTASSENSLEVDFVVNRGSDRCYIQSAWALPDAEKIAREKRPLLHIHDSFAKVIIVHDDINPYRDEQGILTISLFDFLLNTTDICSLTIDH